MLAQHQPSIGETLILANTKYSPNAGLTLAKRLRRWPNIILALGHRAVVVDYGTPKV